MGRRTSHSARPSRTTATSAPIAAGPAVIVARQSERDSATVSTAKTAATMEIGDEDGIEDEGEALQARQSRRTASSAPAPIERNRGRAEGSASERGAGAAKM